ncbi:MAG TPA: hypothetical protein VMK84_32755, partial [Streptosporangiaceae bacterium]|nr:hypothetical protein [Streptosporangiaceae bacterium]
AREPEDIAAPAARRKAHPGPKARDKWVSASVTDGIEDMIAAAYDEAGRRDPQRVRQRMFLAGGNKQQITAVEAQAGDRGLKVPVLIDYIHVSGYLGKAAAALHPGDPAAAGQRADGQLLRVLHGRAKAVAATLASVAAKTRANPRTRHLDLTDMDKAVTYLANNHKHMRYGKALAAGWPIATGMIEGACRFVIEDRFVFSSAGHVAFCPLRSQAVLVRYSSASYRHPCAGPFGCGEFELSGVPGGASRRPGILDRGRRGVRQGCRRRPVLVRSPLRS